MRATGATKGAEARGGGGGGQRREGSDAAYSLIVSHMITRTHTGRYMYSKVYDY